MRAFFSRAPRPPPLLSRREILVAAAAGGIAWNCRRDSAVRREGVLRVASLAPSTTEALFAIGAGHTVVGRSRFCDYPQAATQLPIVGGFMEPNLELLLSLRPTLLVGAPGPAAEAARRILPEAEHYFPRVESVAEIGAMIRGMGERTGCVEQAARVVRSFLAQMEQIERVVARERRTRVLLLYGLGPLVAAGPDSFASELLSRAGGENVLKQGGGYPILGREQLLAIDPEVVLNASAGVTHAESSWKTDKGLSELRAQKTQRIFDVSDERLLRPGPRIAEAVLVFARYLHPELRADLTFESNSEVSAPNLREDKDL